jgi:hypothetical protein
MTRALIERYAERIAAILSWRDPPVIAGTLPAACCAEG